VAKLLDKAWQRDSTLRPSFKAILQEIEEREIFDLSEVEFAKKQKDWRKEIVRTVKSQERLMSSEVTTQNPRELLEQITAKEHDVLLRTERMDRKEAQLRKREMILLAIAVFLVFVVVLLAINTHKLKAMRSF